MSEKTAISWTATYHPNGKVTPGSTWSPVSGCSHKSDGCSFCYAEALSLRFGWSKKPWTAVNARENVILHPERLQHPFKWRQPKKVFVCSMADLFHELVPDDFIAQVFATMNALPHLTFQVLTKRTARLASWPGPWTPNIWAGGTVEDRKALPRIDEVRRCGAAVHYLSFEPLLEDLGPLDLTGIHWAIIGGESGKHISSHPERQMDHAWARSIRDQCVAASVAVWFKQSSGVRSETGTELIEVDGSRTTWRQFPRIPVGATGTPAIEPAILEVLKVSAQEGQER